MQIIIRKMENDPEIRGKAYVHWRCWHEAYAGMVSEAYLEKLTLEKCEQIAFQWRDNILIAKDDERVAGFAGYGEADPTAGELFALYVLKAYWGTGVAQPDTIFKVFEEKFTGKKAALIPLNKKAFLILSKMRLFGDRRRKAPSLRRRDGDPDDLYEVTI